LEAAIYSFMDRILPRSLPVQQALSTLFAYATAWEINLMAEGQAELDDAQLSAKGASRTNG
jgi:hypothetical protein